MGSKLPKVLVPLCDKPVIQYVYDALTEVGIPKPITVIGQTGSQIEEAIGDATIYAKQEEPLGSGHAVISAREAAQGADNILIMCGDSPLFRASTIKSTIASHKAEDATVTLACAILDNPTGYGRIIRNSTGEVSGVVEEKMASEEQKAIQEINGGCLAFDADWLWNNIDLMSKNEAGELCLTEMVDIALAQGKKVITVTAGQDEVLGINTPEQLAEAERVIKSRI